MPLADAAWEMLLDGNRPKAHYLRESLGWANALGLRAEVRPRRGQPVDEILGEAHGAAYSMLGLGSRHGARAARGRSLPDVTAEVAELGQAPLLAVRYRHPLEIGG